MNHADVAKSVRDFIATLPLHIEQKGEMWVITNKGVRLVKLNSTQAQRIRSLYARIFASTAILFMRIGANQRFYYSNIRSWDDCQ